MESQRSRAVELRAAFTLVELLVVIGIIAVLAGILLSVLGRTKQQANIVTTTSNMKQMGVAMLLYASDNNQLLPNRVLDGAGDPKWPALLAQYVGNVQVYVSPIPDVAGRPSYKVTNPTLLTSSSANYTSYMYNGLNDVGGLSDPNVAVRLNSIGLPTQTILLGIPYPQTGFYMDFLNGDNDRDLNKTAFPTGSVYMFCDGSARRLINDPATVQSSPPPDPTTYSDWLWLVNKSNTNVIQ